MAHRRSRKRPRSRRQESRNPGLRKPRDRSTDARTADRGKARRRPAERTAHSHGPPLRIRPDGRRGLLTAFGIALALATVVLAAGWFLNRWHTLSYPDSIWLYLLFGLVAAAPAFGYVARDLGDIRRYAVATAVLPLLAMLVELAVTRRCPPGRDCGAFGATGAFGLPVSLLMVAVLAAASLLFGWLALKRARGHRRHSGRISVRLTAATMAATFGLVGVPVAAVLTGADILARTEPALAKDAVQIVERSCYSPLQVAPKLVVEPASSALADRWTTFHIGAANEKRKLSDGSSPSEVTAGNRPSPYEAVIAMSGTDTPTLISCRFLNPVNKDVSRDEVRPLPLAESAPNRPPSILGSPGSGPNSPLPPAAGAFPNISF